MSTDLQGLNLVQRAWRALTMPHAADAGQARQEYLTKVTLVILGAVALIANIPFVIGWVIAPQVGTPLASILISVLLIGGWIAAQRGHWRLSSYLPPTLAFAVALSTNWYEGVGSAAMLYYAMAILLTAALQGVRAQWIAAALALLAYLGIGMAHAYGNLTPPPVPEATFERWAPPVSFMLLAIAFLQWFSINQYQQTLGQAHSYAAQLEQAQEALRHHARTLAQLTRLGQELSASLDLQQIAELLARVATEIIGSESVSVWLIDKEQAGELVCWTSSDHILYDEKHSPVNLRLRAGQGIAGWVAQHGESVIVNDAPADPRFFAGIEQQIGFRTHSLLAVPLRTRGTTVGVLEILNKLAGQFTPDDLNLAEMLAASTAVAIDNARLVQDLRCYAANLEAQNAELDAFAHTVAHDLKNPLAALISASDLLRNDLDQIPVDKRDWFLDIIHQNSRKMSNIIDELLLLASVRKMEEVKLGPLDMAAIVPSALERLSGMIADYQAEITAPDAAAWPAALGYGPWVEEIWVNYISNAIKYGGDASTPPRVEVGATLQADGRVRFWVRDNGRGLTPDEQARLFTQFTRLHQIKAEGHGLGLSIVRRIADKLGGEVGVESEIGRGSVFYFTLPAAPKILRNLDSNQEPIG